MKNFLFIMVIMMAANVFGAVSLVYPNGNEPLKRGQTVDIRWIDNFPEKVKIELLKDEVFYSTISDSTESDSLFAWNVPSEISGDYFRIKISSILAPETESDISDLFFDILPGVIANVALDTHHVLPRGSSYDINWVDDIEEDVKIELYQNNTFIREIVPVAPSSGNYSYMLPPEISGSGYKFKVSSVTLPETVYAWSEGEISIMSDYIKDVTPRMNELIPRGMEYYISWEQNEWSMYETKIELYQNGDYKQTVADWNWNKKDDGKMPHSYSYYFPLEYSGSGYKFKITGRIFDGSGGYSYISAWSGGELSIMSDYINNVSPRKNEVIPRANGGMEYYINWEQSDFSMMFETRIELYKNGNFINTVADWNLNKKDDEKMSHSVPYYFPFEYYGSGYKFKISGRRFDGLGGYDYFSTWSEGDITLSEGFISDVHPDNSEIFFSGSQAEITWNDNIVEHVDIELFKDGTLHSVIGSSVESSGVFMWNIPIELYGDNFKIKVSSVSLPTTVYSVSEGSFKILQDQLVLTSFNNPKKLPENSQVGIEWKDNITENIKLELFQSGSYYSDIISSTPSSGLYEWSLPLDLTGENFQIKISSELYPEINDMSAHFSIDSVSVTLISLNGGQILKGSRDYEISWIDNFTEDIQIDLYQSDVFFDNIVSVMPSTGSYFWEVPNDLYGSDFKIRISSVIQPDDIYDISSKPFSIYPSFIEEVSPSNMVQILPESQYEIKWIDNIDDDVRIELCDEYGMPFQILADFTESDGSFIWDPVFFPINDPSFNYKFKIQSVDSPEIYSFSSGSISVKEYYISNVAPVSEVILNPDSDPSQAIEIMWDSNLAGTSANIELVDETGMPQFWINSVPIDMGYYLWQNAFIPYDPAYPARKYNIKVSCFFDFGNGPEEISSLSSGEISVKLPYISYVTPKTNIKLSPYPSLNQNIEVMWDSNVSFDWFTEIVLCEDETPVSYIAGTNNTGYYLCENIDTSVMDPNKKYRIKVFMNLPAGEINAFSTGEISVNEPVLNSVTPVNTDYIFSGDSYHITWADNFSDSVKIELLNNETFHSEITLSTASDGSYIWTTPDSLTGNDFKIKVSCVNDFGTGEEFSCLSPGNLRIIAGPVMTVAPNGGEIVENSSEYEILWMDRIDENVRIELYQNGSFLSEISSSVPSSGSFLWEIPSGLTGDHFQIRLVSVTTADINGISDGYFSIIPSSTAPGVPANVTTSIVSGMLKIDWDDMPNANSYHVYSSSDPHGEFTLESVVTSSTWSGTVGTASRKFYHIVSSSESFKNSDEESKTHIILEK
ncbi:MAG: hypothetical protein JXN63_04245 [Candidatus Delongbacteria bacterium]|nr:hypothetical protein [Candidatus Delongbacteria bacterium]